MREVYVSKRLSKRLVLKILSQNPDVERIIVPKSILERASKRVINALKAAGVQVVASGRGRGRPRKYDPQTIKRVKTLFMRGKRAREISEELGLPLRTVYYLLRAGRPRVHTQTKEPPKPEEHRS